MLAGSPTYLRSDHEENVKFKRRSEDLETKLHVTGLRERRLIVLLVVLALLIILSFCVLIMNIFLIRTLGITSHGIRHLHIHAAQSIATGSEVNVVQFTAESIHLGNIITKTGSVFGLPEKDFSIDGSRVIIHGGSNNRSRFTLHDGYCRLEDVDQFTVKNQKRLLFSATNPVFRVDRRVKKIAAGQLITNKIRSPVNEHLHVDVENLSVRGNEGVHMEAKRFNLTAKNSIDLRTSEDGRIHINGERVHFGSNWLSLPVSSSPALTASIDAFRICICVAVRPKLFLVMGNKPCVAPPSLCT